MCSDDPCGWFDCCWLALPPPLSLIQHSTTLCGLGERKRYPGPGIRAGKAAGNPGLLYRKASRIPTSPLAIWPPRRSRIKKLQSLVIIAKKPTISLIQAPPPFLSRNPSPPGIRQSRSANPTGRRRPVTRRRFSLMRTGPGWLMSRMAFASRKMGGLWRCVGGLVSPSTHCTRCIRCTVGASSAHNCYDDRHSANCGRVPWGQGAVSLSLLLYLPYHWRPGGCKCNVPPRGDLNNASFYVALQCTPSYHLTANSLLPCLRLVNASE